MPKNIVKIGMFAGIVLVAQMILTQGLYPVLGRTTQTMFAISDIQPASGVGGQQIGNKLIGYLSGYIPFDITNFSVWIAMYIGVFALVYLGMMLYEQNKVRLWKGRNETQKLFAILLYGHIVLYAVLFALKWQVPGIGFNLLIGLGVNLLLISTLIVLVASKVKFIRV